AAAPAFAQNTSAGVGGRITRADGAPVSRVQVTIVNNESGSSQTFVTDENGRYGARGLRVGGPYTIMITKNGVTEKREGVYLQLAETTNVDLKIASTTTELAAINVTASKDTG